MTTKNRIRVAVFTSGIRGYWMLRELFNQDFQDRLGIEIVGVATDDPNLKHSNAKGRGVWKYGYDPEFEPQLVPRICRQHGIVAYTGSIKTSEFRKTFEEDWKPDIGLMNVYGQFLPPTIFKIPPLGFYNFHATSGEHWPAYQGPDPFTEMMANSVARCCLAFHKVVDEVDGGDLVCYTDRAEIPAGATVPDLHMITAPLAVTLLRRILPEILGVNLQ